MRAALSVCERRTQDLDDLLDDKNLSQWTLVTDAEWEILSDNILSEQQLKVRKHNEFMTHLDNKPYAEEAPPPEHEAQ